MFQGGSELVLGERGTLGGLCVFLASFNDAEAERRGSVLTKVPGFPVAGGTGTPAACENNAGGYACT